MNKIPGLFSVPSYGDTTVSGMRGSDIHVRETPFGCGTIADQTILNGNGRHIGTFNRFNSEIDKLLAPTPGVWGEVKK